jgi:Protein of unknown function (DUF3047)
MIPLPTIVLGLLLGAGSEQEAGAPRMSTPSIQRLDVRRFQVVERTSGPVNYYQVVNQAEGSYLRARYQPTLQTTVLGVETPKASRRSMRGLRWRWRVHVLPVGADDCKPKIGDAAAGVFATFQAGLKTRVLKYVWNTTGSVGGTCQMARSLFFDKDEVILRVGPPLDTWVSESVDPRADYVRSFGGHLQDVPDLVGIGVLTDGDATRSPSEADYGDFELVVAPGAR